MLFRVLSTVSNRFYGRNVKILNAQIFRCKFVQNRMGQFAGFVLKKTITCDIMCNEVYIGDLRTFVQLPCNFRRTA